MSQVLYLSDRRSTAFEASRSSVDVVCAGDSITGWNNYGGVEAWPHRTYPEFLQRLCEPLGLRVADGGIAGEVSPNGVGQVRDYLGLFPNARYVVIGYGTNDLGRWPEAEVTSPLVVENVGLMAGSVREGGRTPILLNVPDANGSMFAPEVARGLRGTRDFHNDRLEVYCREHRIPPVDVRSKLRDVHLADSLHPNEEGARIIAEEVFRVLAGIRRSEVPDR